MPFALAHFPIIWLSFFALSACALRLLRFDRLTYALFAIATALFAWRFVTTTIYVCYNDLGGHLRYIQFVANHHYSLPPPTGWVPHHPPLYYWLAAAGFNIARFFELAPPIYGSRLISVCTYLGFAVASALLLRQVVTNLYIRALALSIVLFWPSSICASVKISDDALVSCFITLTFYFCVRLLKERSPQALCGALICAGFGMATKGSAMVAIASLGAVVFYLLWRKKLSPAPFVNRWVFLCLAIFMIGSSLNFVRIMRYEAQTGEHVKWFVNRNEDLTKFSDYVGNRLTDFIYFDLYQFIAQPYNNLDRNTPTSNLFWNANFKTLLFDNKLTKAPLVAQLLSFIFACYLAYMLSSLLLQKSLNLQKDEVFWLVWLCIGLTYFMVMSARYQIPVSTHAHGRYMHFVIALFAAIFARCFEQNLVLGRSKSANAGLVIGLFLSIFSLAFWVAQQRNL